MHNPKRYTYSISSLAMTILASLALVGCGADEPMQDHPHGDHDSMGGHMDNSAHMTEHAHSGEQHGSDADIEKPADARQITITATNYAFDPAEIKAAPGEKLFIRLVNEADTVHMWQIKELPETHVHTPVGETSAKTITAPSEPGTYNIFCGATNHEELGMVGTLKVSRDPPALDRPSDGNDEHVH